MLRLPLAAPLLAVALATPAFGQFSKANSATIVYLGAGCGSPAPVLSMEPLGLGKVAKITLESAFPNAMAHLFIGLAPSTRIKLSGCTFFVNPSLLLFSSPLTTDKDGRATMLLPVPDRAFLSGWSIVLQATIWAPNGPFFGDHLSNGLWARFGPGRDPGECVVIIDEDTIDNGHSNVEESAGRFKVKPDWLVNDDRPTEKGNPWLRWNTEFAGDITILPGGQVDDEGWFALPERTPWPVADFVAGIVPQARLDKIADVMPLRNQDLAAMVGQTCVAVVYDSDISMNYRRINANLQGARYGLFAFKVLDVLLAGTRPESKSSTSLYDLRVRVLGPMKAGNQMIVPIHDHEPDSVAITRATFRGATLTVEATSDFGRNTKATCSVDGAFLEEPMTWENGRFVLRAMAWVNLVGRRVSVQTDHGGAYNGIVR